MTADGSVEPPAFFISRATEDATVAHEVADVLKSSGCGVFYQDEHIPIGSNFVLKMEEALRTCPHMVVLMSGNYVNSPWCNQEWASFYADKVGRNNARHLAIIQVGLCDVPSLLRPFVRATLHRVADISQRRSIIIEATRVQQLKADALGYDARSIRPEEAQKLEDTLAKLERLTVLRNRARAAISSKIADEVERQIVREFIGL